VEKLHEVSAEAVLQDTQVLYGQLVEADRSVVAAREAEMMANMTPFFAEVRCQLPSGRLQWNMLASAPRRMSDGRIVCDGVELDITERKRAEEERAYLSSIVKFSDDAIIGKGCDCVVQSWNEGAERLYGYTASEMVRESIYRLAPPDRFNEITDFLEQIKRGEAIEHPETVRVRKDGELIDVSVTVSPILDTEGRITGASAVARSITERKRVAEALRESEERFRTTFETAGIGMAVVDLRGRPIQCNPPLQRMLGYTEDELLSMSFADFTYPEDRAMNVQLYRDLIKGKRDSYQIEKRYIRKDGQIVWGFLTVSLVKDARGRPRWCWYGGRHHAAQAGGRGAA
jgi:PAS domain S-box-containing protein